MSTENRRHVEPMAALSNIYRSIAICTTRRELWEGFGREHFGRVEPADAARVGEDAVRLAGFFYLLALGSPDLAPLRIAASRR